MLLACMLTYFGPLMSMQKTPHLNEQPAIWCYYSVFQVFFLVGMFRFHKINYDASLQMPKPIPKRIVVPGGWGEEPLVYVYMDNDNNEQKTPNGTNKTVSTSDKHKMTEPLLLSSSDKNKDRDHDNIRERISNSETETDQGDHLTWSFVLMFKFSDG